MSIRLLMSAAIQMTHEKLNTPNYYCHSVRIKATASILEKSFSSADYLAE